jgi:hypothetical protein
MKKFLITAFKVAFAAGLIAWLVYTDKLEFRSLRIFVDRPDVLAFHIGAYVVVCLVLGVIRWTILMRALDLEISYWRALQLQMIGFFFNTAVPGAVGGDIVKAVYVMREQKNQRKAPALLTVLLDRIVGVAALFLIAAVAVVLNESFVVSHRAVWPLAMMALGGSTALLVAAVAVFFPFKEGRDPFLKLLGRKWPGFAAIESAYVAMRVYRTRPWALIICLGISILMQTINTLYTIYVSTALTGIEHEGLTFALVYPLAVLTTALPLAPGGMGVGHVAFDSFYRLVGWTGGANVFNVVILATLALNLLGVIPYLFFRAQVPKEEVEKLDALVASGG